MPTRRQYTQAAMQLYGIEFNIYFNLICTGMTSKLHVSLEICLQQQILQKVLGLLQ